MRLRLLPVTALATLAIFALTGCVTSYSYRNDAGGGDYYYAEPSVDYRFIDDGLMYGYPYGSWGYGHPGGWYGSFGYRLGFGMPYSRYGFSYFGYPYYDPYFGYPYYGYPYHPHRHHRPQPPGSTTPPVTTPRPPTTRPWIGDNDGDGEPDGDARWRRDGIRPRIKTPQPAINMGRQWEAPPGAEPRLRPRTERPRPVAVPQPSMESRPRPEAFRAPPPPRAPRAEHQEREFRREQTP